MKKTTLLTILLTIFTVFSVKSQTAVQPTGSGTASNPYQIETLDNLYWLSQNSSKWDKYYIQTADINAYDTRNWDGGNGFSPIGNYSTNFTGHYDGQGHTIEKLYIDRTSTDYIGLFGYTNGADIRNLCLERPRIDGHDKVGHLVGYAKNTTLNEIALVSLPTSTYYHVNGNDYVGGLAGYITYSTTVTRCFNMVAISANSYVGGLVGYQQNMSTITESYSAAKVEYTSSYGRGFVGYTDEGDNITYCFYDWDISDCNYGSGGDYSSGIKRKTTEKMKDMCTYVDGTNASWDFQNETINGTNDYWSHSSSNYGYPALSWQGYTHTKECCGYTEDNTPPEDTTLNDIVAECSVTVTPPKTYDNCSDSVTATTSDPLTYTEQGTYVITWTFTDDNNNTTQQTQNVIIDDTTPPVTPTLSDLTGECSVTATAPTTTDNCAGTITATTSDPITYTTQGSYTIHWVFDDGNGNSITVNQNVIVDDVTPPVTPTLSDVSGDCMVSVSAPTTTDNCAGTLTATTSDPTTYTTQGTHTIHWIFDDGNGNSITVNQNVTVNDTPPVITSQHNDTNIVAGNCNLTIPDFTSQVIATDDCDNDLSISQTPAPGTSITSEQTTITITVTDDNGNTDQVSFVAYANPEITVQPEANVSVCPNTSDITLFVNATGCNLNYQWYKNNVAIPGATDSVLVLDAISGSAGTYYCEISNAVSTVTSNTSIVQIGNTSDEVFATNIAFYDETIDDVNDQEQYYGLPYSMNYNPTNPDNLVNAGRYVRFKLEVENHLNSGQSITLAQCKISTSSPYITITDSVSGLNNIGWGQRAWSTDEFEIYIAPETPNGYSAIFTLEVENAGITYQTTCIPVLVMPLVCNNYNIDDDTNPDSDGNSNNIVEPNETIEILPYVDNISSYDAIIAQGQLSNFYSYSGINVWADVQGVSGNVQDWEWWNMAFGHPDTIEAGETNLLPEFDFVFDYNYQQQYKLDIPLIFSAGFKLFDDTLTLIKFATPVIINPEHRIPVLQDNNNLTADMNNVKYQWYDCDNDLILSADTNQIFNFSQDGSYAVIVTYFNNQTDTSACINVTATSVNSFTNNNNIRIYPNPADNILNIETGNIKINNIEIFDITGKQIIQANDHLQAKTQIDVSRLKPGMYYIKINPNNNSIVKQFVKISR